MWTEKRERNRMNRTLFCTACLAAGCLLSTVVRAQAPDLTNSEALTFDDGAGNSMPYRLFVPPELDPERPYPLVLFLHGAGERGTDNLLQVRFHIDHLINATQGNRYTSYLVAPQVPRGGSWTSTRSLNLVQGILDEVQRNHSVDARRLYVTGLSMGGFGTLWQLFHFPKTFAAAVPLSGGIPRSQADGVAAVIKDIPTWVFHGSADRVVPVDWSRAIVEAMRNAGGMPRYTEYRGSPHNIWTLTYRDRVATLYPWLYSQALPGGAPRFVRGDADSNGVIELTDGIRILGFLFLDDPAPSCLDAADALDDGVLNLTDAIRIFGWLFTGGSAPDPPGPRPGLATYRVENCGLDKTDDTLGCEIPAMICP